MYSNKVNDNDVSNKARNAIKDTKNDVKDMVEDAAVETRQQLRSIARETGAKVQDFITDRKAQFDDARDSAERTIRSKPFVSTGVALAAGFVLGRLLKRG